MSFQVLSDIHLELYPECNSKKLIRIITSKIEPAVPFLFLAGDIGQLHRPNYRFFLEWCSNHFEKVFVITGNHEYYTSVRLREKKEHTMKKIDKRHRADGIKNVYFLQKDRIDFTHKGLDYTVLGCTLWAKISKQYRDIMPLLMNDFSQIFSHEHFTLSPRESNELHKDHAECLFGELETLNDTRQIIVLTHHAPSLRMDRSIPCGYATNYEHGIGKHVHAWISGHTHVNKKLQTDHGTWLISNCIGYATEKVESEKSCLIP